MTNPRKAGFNRPDKDLSPLDAFNIATGNTVKEQMVPLDQLIVDDAVQVRVNGTVDAVIETYAAVLRNGGTLDAVTVFRDSYGDFHLADGFHRYYAHVKDGRLEINAYVQDGDREDVLNAAEEGNLGNSLMLSLGDKKNILFRKLARKTEWVTLSSREIGRLMGVSHKTVGRWVDEYNAEVASTGTGVPVDRTVVKGADGREINTTNIGTNQPVREPEPESSPPAPPIPPVAGATSPHKWREGRGEQIDERGEVMPGPGFTGRQFPAAEGKPIDTGANADVRAPQSGEEAVIFRQYAVETPLVTLHQAIDQLLLQRDIKILEEAEFAVRRELVMRLAKSIGKHIDLWTQLVTIDPDLIDESLGLMDGLAETLKEFDNLLLENFHEELAPPIPSEDAPLGVPTDATSRDEWEEEEGPGDPLFMTDEEYLDDDVLPMTEEAAQMLNVIMEAGFDIQDYEPDGDGWRVQVTMVVENIKWHNWSPEERIASNVLKVQHDLATNVRIQNAGKRLLDEKVDGFENPVEIGAWLVVQPTTSSNQEES